jgi:hypothetical protein
MTRTHVGHAYATAPNRRVTWVLAASSAALVVSALLVGVADHLPGIVLAYLASAAAVLAFSHAWKDAGSFGLLAAGALAAFVVLVVLANLVSGVEPLVGGVAGTLVGGLAAAAFLGAVLVCPAAFVIGVAGALLRTVRGR